MPAQKTIQVDPGGVADQIVELARKRKYTQTEIAKICGVSRQRVSKVLIRCKVVTRGISKRSFEVVRRHRMIRKMYEEDVPVADIALAVRLKPRQVYYVLEKLDIPRRKAEPAVPADEPGVPAEEAQA